MFAGQHRADAVQPRAPFFGDLGGGEGTTVVLWHCSLVSARMGHGGSLARLGGGLVKRPACQSTIAAACRRPGTDRRCPARRGSPAPAPPRTRPPLAPRCSSPARPAP